MKVQLFLTPLNKAIRFLCFTKNQGLKVETSSQGFFTFTLVDESKQNIAPHLNFNFCLHNLRAAFLDDRSSDKINEFLSITLQI